jgi:hypothetical protein
MKEFFVEKNKRIAVYDDLFTLLDRQKFYDFATKSFFRLGWSDGAILENYANMFVYSSYSKEDLDNLEILNKIKDSEAANELDGYVLHQCMLNLSTASDTNYVHSHAESKVLLYYVNLEWRDGWHGETLFFDEPCKNIVFANPYTPGRLISFDATIPHTIRPQSHIAAKYRFTLAIIFNKC